MPFSPLRARIKEKAKRAPAIAIDRVAEPAPALALTTSVPASYNQIKIWINNHSLLHKIDQLRVIYLNALGESFQLISGEGNSRLALRDKRNNSDSCMATNYRAVNSSRFQMLKGKQKKKINNKSQILKN